MCLKFLDGGLFQFGTNKGHISKDKQNYYDFKKQNFTIPTAFFAPWYNYNYFDFSVFKMPTWTLSHIQFFFNFLI